MKKVDILSMGAAALLLTGCASKVEPRGELGSVYPPSATNKKSGTIIPVVSMERPGFMFYSGFPTTEHLAEIRKFCGAATASAQGKGFVISTPDTADCARKIREQQSR